MLDKDQEKVYVDVLLESLERKLKLMHNLMSLTKDQEEILTSEKPDAGALDTTFDMKEMYISQMLEIDEGFQNVYDRVADEVRQNRYQHRPKIEKMQQMIREITALGMSVQALEEQNRQRFEQFLVQEKKEIKSFKVSNKTAASYYRNMANQPAAGQSYFLNSQK